MYHFEHCRHRAKKNGFYGNNGDGGDEKYNDETKS